MAGMENFKENYIYLDVEGYPLFHKELQYASSAPLLSWRREGKGVQKDPHWGCEDWAKPNTSFWITELCLIKGRNHKSHYIPGAYIQAIPNTVSDKSLKYIWRNIMDKYTFQKSEIEDQIQIQEYFKGVITPDTVVFHKGGLFERKIGELCGAKDIVDIQNLGMIQKADIPVPLVSKIKCKVHKHTFSHCPLQETCYFMKKIDQWLPEYKYLE